MHEVGIMQGILDSVIQEARKSSKKGITEIRATVREHGHPMEAASLESLLEMLAKGTAAEGAAMKITVISPTLKCSDCGHSFTAGGALLCPDCHSSKLEAIDAEEVDLECSFTE
jgi:hydrogenase nickel incorporation protein HypA/HybF